MSLAPARNQSILNQGKVGEIAADKQAFFYFFPQGASEMQQLANSYSYKSWWMGVLY